LLGIHVASHFPCFLPLAIPSSSFTSHPHMHTFHLPVLRCGASLSPSVDTPPSLVNHCPLFPASCP
jgi:hypothetical protein